MDRNAKSPLADHLPSLCLGFSTNQYRTSLFETLLCITHIPVNNFDAKATPVNVYYRKTADWLVWRVKIKAKRNRPESESYQAFTFLVPSSQQYIDVYTHLAWRDVRSVGCIQTLQGGTSGAFSPWLREICINLRSPLTLGHYFNSGLPLFISIKVEIVCCFFEITTRHYV